MSKVGLAFFERVGDIYHAAMDEKEWGKALKDPVEALCGFLRAYAYERQNANPSYGSLAAQVVRDNARDLDPTRTWRSFQSAWEEFEARAQLEGLYDKNTKRKLNTTHQPMFHANGENPSRPKTKTCILCRLRPEGGSVANILVEAKTAMEAGKADEIFLMLASVHGIGDKIASFYLRDVADAFDLREPGERMHLQPVDIWVERMVRMASREMTIGGYDVKRWIIDRCRRAGLNELRVNQGMWLFPSQIAGNYLQLMRAMEDVDYAERLLAGAQSHAFRGGAAYARTSGAKR